MKLYEPAPPARKDELANVQDGIAVIVDGDTCPVVVESGMYAYIKNNTHGLAEGLYKNTSDSAFPTSGGTADGTVFEADSTGGLNALNASRPQYEWGTLYVDGSERVYFTNSHDRAPDIILTSYMSSLNNSMNSCFIYDMSSTNFGIAARFGDTSPAQRTCMWLALWF